MLRVGVAKANSNVSHFGRDLADTWVGFKKAWWGSNKNKKAKSINHTVYLDIGWKGRISIVILFLKQERHIGRNSGAPKEEAIK